MGAKEAGRGGWAGLAESAADIIFLWEGAALLQDKMKKS